MCVMPLSLRCATDDGSGAHVLQIVIDELQPSGEGEQARSVIRPSRSLTRTQARTRNLKNSQPQPPTTGETQTRLSAVTSRLERVISQRMF
jgi:hypothetical protein